MKVVGLIAEYNPFHNGHEYHIEKAKKITGADAAVVIMSGDFVQRGTPAIMPKHMRTRSALMCGADLVIELPVCYATGTAEQFAYGAVSILDKLGFVDCICFGSECGNIDSMQEIAQLLLHESIEYKEMLQEFLRLGMSFPTARQNALEHLHPDKDYSKILEQPNNILGIEYLKALDRIGSKMIPYTIQRLSSQYHDIELQDGYSSASAIREAIERNAFDCIYEQIPKASHVLLKEKYNNCYPIYANDFSLLLKYRLLNESKATITEYADVSTDLANRIYNQLNKFVDFDQFCELLKTKELTYSRISRALLHIILGIRKTDYKILEYARVLGFRTESTELLSVLKRYTRIPLVTKLTASYNLSDSAKKMLDADIFASNLYESVITDKFKTPYINEFERPIVIV